MTGEVGSKFEAAAEKRWFIIVGATRSCPGELDLDHMAISIQHAVPDEMR